MNTKPLEGARAKIKRAKDHLDQLKDEIYGKNNPYGIELRHDTDTGQLVAQAKLPRELFTHYAIIAGEIVHQARSALEHVIWEVIPSPKEGRTGFPVFHIEKDYERRGISMIDGINVAAKALIHGLQPFGPDYKTDPLYILNEFWNWDKHRLLNVCAFYPYGVTVRFRFPNRFEHHSFNFPPDAEDGAVLWRASHPGPEVQVHYTMAYDGVKFRDGPAADKMVAPFLLELVQLAEGIINKLGDTL